MSTENYPKKISLNNLEIFKPIRNPYILYLKLGYKRSNWKKFKKNNKEYSKLICSFNKYNQKFKYGVSRHHQDLFERISQATKYISKYIISSKYSEINNLILDYDGMNIDMTSKGRDIRKKQSEYNPIICPFIRACKKKEFYAMMLYDNIQNIQNSPGWIRQVEQNISEISDQKTLLNLSDNFSRLNPYINSFRCYYPNIFCITYCRNMCRYNKNLNSDLCSKCILIKI